MNSLKLHSVNFRIYGSKLFRDIYIIVTFFFCPSFFLSLSFFFSFFINIFKIKISIDSFEVRSRDYYKRYKNDYKRYVKFYRSLFYFLLKCKTSFLLLTSNFKIIIILSMLLHT